MSCPTCGATMQNVAPETWHCPRCGSLLMGQPGAVCVPALVERCREFHAEIADSLYYDHVWNRTGVAEAVGQARPQAKGG